MKKILKWLVESKKRKLFLFFFLVLLIVLSFYFVSPPKNNILDLDDLGKVGGEVEKDFALVPTVALAKNENGFEVKDDLSSGIEIKFASQSEEEKKEEEDNKREFKIQFPSDYLKPIEIKLDQERMVTIADQNAADYKANLLAKSIPLAEEQKTFFKKENLEDNFVAYENGRKSIYYAYQKDQALNERKLKNWIIYNNPAKNSTDKIEEKESYKIENAKIKLNEAGEIEVFYFGQKEIQNEKTMAEVEPSLLDRAQRTIEKDMGEDLLNNSNQTPDFVIPEPYYLNKSGDRVNLEWNVDSDKNTISINFSPKKEDYPIALDPTLQFTAPGQPNGGDVITGEAGSYFASSMAAGDFNADGKTDLAVGAYGYSTNTGRVYIFYNDGSISTTATTADVIITGEASSNFGFSMTSGDFNADGKTDLAVGAYAYSTSTGRAYIFYNDGSIPTTAANADMIITGETSSQLGISMTSGDFNADGKIDLSIGAFGYSTYTGRAYIFYNDGSIPTVAASADVIITGEATNNYFGRSMTSGDLNADGKTDLVIGAYGYSTNTGRAYIFYNDGSIPTTAATADIIITGETINNYFGFSMTSGDFNADGKTDLAVGAYGYSTNTGRAYIFHNDGSIPTAAVSADKIITGETSGDYFSAIMISGDFNSDGKIDLAVGAFRYLSITGRTYVFYNDSSIPATATTADIIITGEATNDQFGRSMTSGDFNADGKIDLAVGSQQYSTSAGRAYIFYSQNGQVNTNFSITGETDNYFGLTLASGDFNADGKIDLVVGSYGYSSGTGRAHIFYNDGSISTTAATADVIITGEAATNNFSVSMVGGDFNADGKTDLAVGAYGYSSNTGRAYIFYNDGIYPASASSADVIITGEATTNNFAGSMVGGDFNADGKTDLAIGAYRYDSFTGRAYIFYNDGSIPTFAASADVIITGESVSNYFGISMIGGDFNADGKTDLAIGGRGYSSNIGRVYIFYNDGSIPTAASSADVIITGEEINNYFGMSVTSGDFNADGKTDLAVGAYGYSSNTGRAYIFYNDGSIPTAASSADVIITGELTNNYFGIAMVGGDFNADGKTDLAVGAYGYSTNTGGAYIFYNDGSIPTTAVAADVKITGEASSLFGYSVTSGDFNADGKTDLAVGAYGYSTNAGKIYIYETRDDYAWQVQTSPGGLRVDPKAGQEIKIEGETTGSYFSYSMTSGDFNADGKMDLAIGGSGYSSGTGRTYIFYNDGSVSNIAAAADVIITGEPASGFGISMTGGDFNADGKTDLAVGAYGYSSYTGRAYIFHNDGSIPTLASSADIIINGEAVNNYFGFTMINGDFNFDGKTDLAVGAYGYSSVYGRAYIFYSDGTIPTTAATADVIITGEAANNSFGYSMTSGDFNSDGRVDFVAGAYAYSAGTGRTYIFYNDGTIPTTAATADVIITGEASSYFGYSMTGGDFNVDGRIDLAVGGYGYSTSTGRAYIFYNDGSIPTTAATANVIITGESSSSFGTSMTSGDFNTDGKTDLAVGANGYSTNTGRAYVFYNDGAIPTTAATADMIITGEASSYFGTSMISGDFNVDGRIDLIVGAYSSNNGNAYIYTFNDSQSVGGATSNYFSASMTSGDFNSDGKIDLAVGAYGYTTNTGRVYVFYNQNGNIAPTAATADVTITGETTNNYFGWSMTNGDFNADGKTDLAVGAYNYSSATGRAYIFYNDGSIPTTAATADKVITGEATSSFGYSMTNGDFNADGKIDLAVGAYQYSSSTGRAYIFYNDGSIPITATTADKIITGGAASSFGRSMTNGDFNADGRIDLAVGGFNYFSNTGRAYIFHNDGSIPTTTDTADVIITGEGTDNFFGFSMTSGDFNADGKIDLAVGARGYSSSTGRVYIFYNDGSISVLAATADIIITGEATSWFGSSVTSGDFNVDGKTDLAVGANLYSSSTGRAYIFYNDSFISSLATNADNIITGETTNSNFGASMIGGDFNVDGKTDLAIGAYGYSTNTGKIYVIISEAKNSEMINTVKQKGTIQLKGGSVKMK